MIMYHLAVCMQLPEVVVGAKAVSITWRVLRPCGQITSCSSSFQRRAEACSVVVEASLPVRAYQTIMIRETIGEVCVWKIFSEWDGKTRRERRREMDRRRERGKEGGGKRQSDREGWREMINRNLLSERYRRLHRCRWNQGDKKRKDRDHDRKMSWETKNVLVKERGRFMMGRNNELIM